MAASESLNLVRHRIGERIAEIEQRAGRLKPIDIAAKMEAIRGLAAEHGLVALEGLADYGAHHAMMPGHREATRVCLSHMDEALSSNRPRTAKPSSPRSRCGCTKKALNRLPAHCRGDARLFATS